MDAFRTFVLLTWLLMAWLSVTTCSAEEPPPPDPTAGSPFEAALEVAEVPPPLPEGALPQVSNEELLRRLQETEAQLRDLQAQRFATDPSVLSTLQDRWSQVRDPSITTVDQQTHDASTLGNTKKGWYDRLSIRGYAQFRYNTTVAMSEDSAPVQHTGDRSVGDNQNFLIRRARLILSGDVSDHMYVYLQPDFASTVPGSIDSNYYAQIRDWYGDLYIDKEKVYRIRIGQSKVPYGWEDMQSSSNRIPLDRSDSINSAVRNERDLGVFFYWTPEPVQDLLKEVLDEGLKGSGNYGALGLGIYNGQGGSLAEQNDNLHFVARLTYPTKLPSGQIVEMSVQGYTGKYTVLSSPIVPLGIGTAVRPQGTLETGNQAGLLDQRIAGTFVWYPQPLGFQAEWNVGTGPGLNDDQTEVIERSLSGGYAMMMYRQETERWGVMFPFVRYNHYRGGYKPERNSPYSRIDEWEFGLEWQFNPQMELVTQYTITDRTNTSAMSSGQSYRQFEGQLLRSQFQINY